MRKIFPHFLPAGFLCYLSLTASRDHRCDSEHNSCAPINWKLKARSRHASTPTLAAAMFILILINLVTTSFQLIDVSHSTIGKVHVWRAEGWKLRLQPCQNVSNSIFRKFFYLYLHPLTHSEFASILFLPHSDMRGTVVCVFPYKTNKFQCMLSVYTPLRLHLFHATQ